MHRKQTRPPSARRYALPSNFAVASFTTASFVTAASACHSLLPARASPPRVSWLRRWVTDSVGNLWRGERSNFSRFLSPSLSTPAATTPRSRIKGVHFCPLIRFRGARVPVLSARRDLQRIQLFVEGGRGRARRAPKGRGSVFMRSPDPAGALNKTFGTSWWLLDNAWRKRLSETREDTNDRLQMTIEIVDNP